jgi:predicted ATPase
MPSWNSRNFLNHITLRRAEVPSFDVFPFTIPAISGLQELEIDQPVTFFVGENGSGKSTLMEAVAVCLGLNAEGGSRNFRFSTREQNSDIARLLRLSRSPRRIANSYFLRAESYFNVATHIESLDLEPGPGARITPAYGGRSLHEQSHGESFFALFMNRLKGNGLYLLDEPEAALSPKRQLAFLSRLHELVGQGSQFLIATHSPIILAYPDATIFRLDDGPPRRVAYHETEHYSVTRDFLTRTDRMLDALLSGGAETD